MPLPVFIIVLAIALVLAGFACACLSDHPLQALERLTASPAATPFPLFDPWALTAFLSLLVVGSRIVSKGLTQADLQRFRI